VVWSASLNVRKMWNLNARKVQISTFKRNMLPFKLGVLRVKKLILCLATHDINGLPYLDRYHHI